MTTVCLTVLCLALLAVLVLRERAHDNAVEAADVRHRDEIRELTTRIQHPNVIPTTSRRPFLRSTMTTPDGQVVLDIDENGGGRNVLRKLGIEVPKQGKSKWWWATGPDN
jgi:hypothetical protein